MSPQEYAQICVSLALLSIVLMAAVDSWMETRLDRAKRARVMRKAGAEMNASQLRSDPHDEEAISAWGAWVGVRADTLKTLINEGVFKSGFTVGRAAGMEVSVEQAWDDWANQRPWIDRTRHAENIFKAGVLAGQEVKRVSESTAAIGENAVATSS